MSHRYRSTPEILRFHPIPPFIFPLKEKFDDKVLYSTTSSYHLNIILNIYIKANYVRGAEANVKLEGKHKRLSRKSSHQIYEKEKLLLLLKRLGRIVKTKERLFDSLQSTVLTTNSFYINKTNP